ncbi:hypothetical protein IWZ00DRAFT_35765 [Phyllosticta capitalensis]|uniref:Uncharacterized protein n=1 Tax=Phyllosticta capitalensis TaxID=121624 RepID=A0ABR1Z4N3_9PEZI
MVKSLRPPPPAAAVRTFFGLLRSILGKSIKVAGARTEEPRKTDSCNRVKVRRRTGAGGGSVVQSVEGPNKVQTKHPLLPCSRLIVAVRDAVGIFSLRQWPIVLASCSVSLLMRAAVPCAKGWMEKMHQPSSSGRGQPSGQRTAERQPTHVPRWSTPRPCRQSVCLPVCSAMAVCCSHCRRSDITF